MLCDHITPHVEKCLGCCFFPFRIIPAVGHLYVYLCVRIHRIDSQGKRINTAGHLRVGGIHGCHIADLVGGGVHSRHDAAQISRLINSSEIIIKVLAVAHISRAVGKIHIRIFFRHLCRSLHISPAGGEDDVASLVDTFLNGLSCRLGIAVVDIDLTYDLIIGQSQILLHTLNTQIMSISVATALHRIRQMQYSYLDLLLWNPCSLCCCAAAAFRLHHLRSPIATSCLISDVCSIIVHFSGTTTACQKCTPQQNCRCLPKVSCFTSSHIQVPLSLL